MPTLVDAISPVLEVLDAADIRAWVSMRDIDPPGVYIPIPELAFRFKDGSFTATYRIVLVVPNTSRELAIQSLSELLERVQVAIGRRATSARPVEVVLADNSAVVLAYELTFDQVVRNC